MTDYSTELQFALDVAKIGGAIAAEHYRTDPQRSQKKDGTWVTEADTSTEAVMREHIASAWPEHNVLGEEEGLAAARGGEPLDGAPTWVIDPIDGTNNFMSEIPTWATLIALRVEDRSVVGVAHAPALGEIYDAAEGLGARFNGHSMSVDKLDSLERATVFFGGDKGFYRHDLENLQERLVLESWRTRGFGDFWGHVLVARGAGHVMIEPHVSLWDVAALEVIVSEAGGRLTHIDGSVFSGEGSCLSTNGILHDQVVAMATDVR
ncbi:MAG: inositol monophosphatase family protein [Actinomycetota bacterium]|jgi:histidinol-phosphatase